MSNAVTSEMRRPREATNRIDAFQPAKSTLRPIERAELRMRRATIVDREPIRFFFDTALRRDYFVRRGQLDDLLLGRYHDVFVAELGGVLVGIAIKTQGTRLVNVLIHPAYRGLRIGQALIEATGATEVRAKIDMSSGDPRGFYEGLGFQSTGQFNEKGNIELMRRGGPPANAGQPGGAAAPAGTPLATGPVRRRKANRRAS
ncbi:MAG: GNAT family N-acetyltransferase [Phycisphaerae bacterium]|nr:GNAT family N-acetyltransferase [Phycisphaerae bacterium]